MDLTDDQWDASKDLFSQFLNQGAGRLPQSSRRILDTILWKLRTGASWLDLPPGYPSHQTCFRRYTLWDRSGVLEAVVKALASHLSSSGVDLNRLFQEHEIEYFPIGKRIGIRFAPHLQDTRQSSTALLIIQFFFVKKRRKVKPLPRLDQVSMMSEE
jgi:transposase